MGVLDSAPRSFDEYVAGGGGRGLERALAIGPQKVIEEVSRSGLRGRGGAGFPTGQKWSSIRTAGVGRRYAVCNAAEGEPATYKDRALLRNNPYQVIEGLEIAALAVGAEGAAIGVKEAFDDEVALLAAALTEMDAQGALPVPVDLVPGPDEYLFGEETGLLEVIEGRPPLPRGVAPFVRGLGGTASVENPTAVNNVETLANVPHVVADGAEWLRAVGTEDSPGSMVFTVAGDVRREGVFELPLGTPLRTLIEEHAGGCVEGRGVKAILPGASNTVIVPEQLDTPLDFGSMSAAGTALGAGGFAVYDDSTCIAEVALLFSRFLYVESCGQCPPCKFGSAEITDHLGRFEGGEGTVAELDVILARARSVTDGQKCALPSGESLLIQSIVHSFGPELRAHADRRCDRHRDLVLPKIVGYDEERGRFAYDLEYGRKRPDWTYAPA